MNSKIKKKQIIIELFSFITQSMIKNNIFNVSEVQISLAEFENYINEKLGAHINSIQHIYQQIRTYERENHIHLFDKVSLKEVQDRNDILLRLAKDHDYYYKLFLHVSLKTAIAAGAYDLISNLYKDIKIPLNLYLSAGTESYYFIERLYTEVEGQINIYTHNLGIIQDFINQHIHLKHIKMYTRFGYVTPNELVLLEKNYDHYAETDFHAIIGSTTFIDESGVLYIESKNEFEYKKDVYKVLKGPRILLLSLFEYNILTEATKYEFAHAKDFDYIVIPSEQLIARHRQLLKKLPFTTIIKYYNYEVLKNVNKLD